MINKYAYLPLLALPSMAFANDNQTWSVIDETNNALIPINVNYEPVNDQTGMIDFNNQGSENDNQHGLQQRLVLSVPINANWRFSPELEYGKLDSKGNQSPPEGEQKLARIGVGYRQQQHDLRLAIHSGNAYDDYMGFSLQHRYNLNRDFQIEYQVSYHDTGRESPELQLYAYKDQFRSLLRWQNARYKVNAEAFINRFYRQDSDAKLANGDGLMIETAYRPFSSYHHHWLSLALRVADYDQSQGASLPNFVPPPAPPAGSPLPPPPPMPSVAPKNSQEFSVNWSYNLNNEMVMEPYWQPIFKTSLLLNQGEGGYFALVGLEGPIMGKDRLRIAFSAKDTNETNNSTNASLEKKAELRYQARF